MTKLQQMRSDFCWTLFNIFPLMRVNYQVVIWYLWMLWKAVLDAQYSTNTIISLPFTIRKGKKCSAVLAHPLDFCCEENCSCGRSEFQGPVCWEGWTAVTHLLHTEPLYCSVKEIQIWFWDDCLRYHNTDTEQNCKRTKYTRETCNKGLTQDHKRYVALTC